MYRSMLILAIVWVGAAIASAQSATPARLKGLLMPPPLAIERLRTGSPVLLNATHKAPIQIQGIDTRGGFELVQEDSIAPLSASERSRRASSIGVWEGGVDLDLSTSIEHDRYFEGDPK